MHTRTVLLVPPGYDGPVDSAVDVVREDETVERPGVIQERVPDEGDTSVDRAMVTDQRKEDIALAIDQYESETAKDVPDPQVQIAALERVVSFMWDVISGEDVGAALLAEQEKTATDNASTDDTSA
ncbi:hypothetical protein [Halorubrum sp. F4]|uniref:hypothetical protein n=1 Tax=Halorubrum sp. F4 TaxID=2989715 RepID=UPI0024807738|nr:hypothetical protein [Halorubrum sp. F4]